MMEVSNNCDVSYKLRERSHIEKETEPSISASKHGRVLEGSPFVKPRLGHVFLLYSPFSYLNGGDDGFCKWLRVLFLNQGLNIFTVHFRS